MVIGVVGRSSRSVCSVHRFSVGVLPGTKLESGPATLHMCNSLLALARDSPPVVVAHWNLPDLRRYGPVPNGFVFEGGTRCGYCKCVCLHGPLMPEMIKTVAAQQKRALESLNVGQAPYCSEL